jgi:hypothetical protein
MSEEQTVCFPRFLFWNESLAASSGYSGGLGRMHAEASITYVRK